MADLNVRDTIRRIMKDKEAVEIMKRAWKFLLEKPIGYDISYIMNIKGVEADIEYLEEKREFLERYESLIGYDEEELRKLSENLELDPEDLEEITESEFFTEDGILPDWSDGDEKELENLEKKLKSLYNLETRDIISTLFVYLKNKAQYLLKYPKSLITFFM